MHYGDGDYAIDNYRALPHALITNALDFLLTAVHAAGCYLYPLLAHSRSTSASASFC
jgi:hypothetical protein